MAAETQKLLIEETLKTPSIDFDPDKGTLVIEGRSIQTVPAPFYRPVLSWIEDYTPKKGMDILVRIQFYIYNTPSAKCIIMLLRKLEELHVRGNNVEVRWEYEEGDDDALNDGQEYKGLVSNLPFEIVTV